MADNLAKGSKELEGKGGSLKGGKKLAIKKSPKRAPKDDGSETLKVGTGKMNESGKGSGGQ